MVSVCLPSDALLQHLPSYLGFSYLGRGVSLHGCSSKAQPLLLTLDEGYLLTAALPDLPCINIATFKNVFQYQRAKFNNWQPQLILHQPNTKTSLTKVLMRQEIHLICLLNKNGGNNANYMRPFVNCNILKKISATFIIQF